MSIYCTEFLAIYHASLEYCHILWETTLPTLVMTDNQSVTRFIQTKAIPTLWNACDYVLPFIFHIMHVEGMQNTAAEFLSRTDLNSKERIERKIRNDITIRTIQVNLQSTDVADTEQLFLPRRNNWNWRRVLAPQTLFRKIEEKIGRISWFQNAVKMCRIEIER